MTIIIISKENYQLIGAEMGKCCMKACKGCKTYIKAMNKKAGKGKKKKKK